MTPQEAVRFRRNALEKLAEPRGPGPSPIVAPRYLPGGTFWALEAIIDQLEILELEGRITLIRVMDPSQWGVTITPFGRKSLEVAEEVWDMKNKPVVNSNTTNITGSTVGNVAQMAGSHGSTIIQSTTSNDLKSVLDAINQLVAAVKASPTIDAPTKNDAQSEAEQLKGELGKTKPNPSRIKDALEWFKTAAGVAEVVPKLAEVWDKVKVFLPGAF